MNSLFERLRTRRLAFTFTILATLSAGILIGSIVAGGVHGQEKRVDSSDATPLSIPSPKSLSNAFTQIAKQVGPAVVNINTESLPKSSPRSRRNPHGRIMPMPAPQNPDNGQGDEEDDNGAGPGGQGGQGDMQDFFQRFFGGPAPEEGGDGGGVRQSLGSGFIVDPRGYIITNNHVVDKADKIFVKLSTDSEGDPGRPAKVVGTDKDTDIAVIKIESKEPLPTVKLGNSDGAQVGDWVIAIGSPFGLNQTVTAGIVSSKNRDIEKGQQGQFQRFIQTDAAINPGNSGGPLVDMDGQVVGMNTAIYTQSMGSQGVGFAMPANTVINTYNQLIGPEHKVVRGSIGITFSANPSSSVARVYGFKNGVLISSVQPNFGADKAGLKVGDTIVSIDGRPIKDGDDLVGNISARKPGSTAKVGYLREGKEASTTVTISNRADMIAAGNAGPGNSDDESAPGAPDASQGKLGISVKAITPEQASKIGIKGGVIIQSIRPGSFADELQQLQPGQIIIAVNKKAVASEADLRGIVSGLKSGDDVVFAFTDPRDRSHATGYVGGTLP